MAQGAYGKLGFARSYALIFGVTYIAVSLLELILGGGEGLRTGDFVILQRTTLHNLIHWATGIVVLGSFFAGEGAARIVARIVGVIFAVLTIWGFVAPGSLGSLLGYGGDLPMVYNLIHLVTALAALFAGFAGRRSYRTAPAA